LIEAKLVRNLPLGRRVDESSRRKEDVNDISRDQAEENENDHGHPEQGQESRDKPLEEIDMHAAYLFSQTSCMRP
jgi:hypothetical protein